MSVIDMRGLPSALFGSGVDRRVELSAWDAALRGGLSTTRRIGFLSLAPASGVTTLAVHVTRIIASRRTEPVLAIDASGGNAGLGARLGAKISPPSSIRASARTTAEALTGLVERERTVALRPETSAGPVAAWLTEAAPIARFFEVAVTDFGARNPLVDAAACAALCDVVCIVAQAARTPVEYARALAPAIAALPEGPTPVIALVDPAREGGAVARMAAARAPHPVIFIPHDPQLAAGGRPLRLSTRRSLLRLAATLVSGGAEARR